MKDRDSDSPNDPARAARETRERRLAEALRANLRRRKGVAQSPAGKSATDTPENRPGFGANKGEGR